MRILGTIAVTLLLAATGCGNKDDNGKSSEGVAKSPASEVSGTAAESKQGQSSTTTAAKPAAVRADDGAKLAAEAKAMFAARCVACHGDSGKGDGVAASALNPKPRDYTDSEWQKKVTDAEIEAIILKGGPAVGKAATMPPNPDFADRPELVAALRALIRGFGPK